MDHEPEQVFYKLSELSEMLGVENSVLRFWEKEFSQIKPMKVGPRKRLYRRKDLDIFQEIKRLLYEERFTIAGAKKRLDSRTDSRQRHLFDDHEDKLASALAASAPAETGEKLAEARSRLEEARLVFLEIRKMLSSSSKFPSPGKVDPRLSASNKKSPAGPSKKPAGGKKKTAKTEKNSK